MAWEGPGFVDHHTHLLRVAAGVRPCYDPTSGETIAEYHHAVARRGSSPMDEPPEPMPGDPATLGARLEAGLRSAAADGLVEITEAGMREWAYFDALRRLRDDGPLPVRVRILVASGLADVKTMRRTGDPFLDVIGIKLYADGWLGPRTCALCSPFADVPDDHGILFQDATTLARRIEPFAERGWTVATHAIGDRAMDAVLDAYEMVYGDDCGAAAPRIEHAQILRPDLIERVRDMGVVACIQPSFAVSDASAAREALDAPRLEHAYRWDLLLAAGARVITGSDFPIEVQAPLLGLRHLVTGAPVGGDPVAAPLPLEQALALMTDAAAGTTVLSDAPADADPEDLHDIEVLETRPAG